MKKQPQQELCGRVPRRRVVTDSASETSLHQLKRTTDERHPVVRLLWLLAFLTLVGALCRQLVVSVQKLHGLPVSTLIEPNNATFVFPDVHVCSCPLISASYPSAMGDKEKNYTETEAARIDQLLSRVNSTSMYPIAQAFMNTVPYGFLSENFGMRMEQSILQATVGPMNIELQLGTDVIQLRHHEFLNCFTIRPRAPAVSTLLGNVLAYLDLSLFADASYKTPYRFGRSQIDARGLSFTYYEALISSGFRLYFTPRGVYPDEHSPSVTVSPGFTHHVKLSMTVSKLPAEKGECLDNVPDVQYLDQSTLQPVNYTYTLPACYAEVLMKQFAEVYKSYIPGVAPIPYAYRHLTNSFNFSLLNASSSTAEIQLKANLMRSLYDGTMITETVDLVRNTMDQCAKKAPCREVLYTPSLSSIKSPLMQDLKVELSSLLKLATAAYNTTTGQNYSTPGRDWLVALFLKATRGSATPSDDAELARAVTENLLRIQISTGEMTSTELEQTVNYRSFDLMVEVGGLMSFFIGGSLLSLFEVLEFLLCLLFGRQLNAAPKDERMEDATAKDDEITMTDLET